MLKHLLILMASVAFVGPAFAQGKSGESQGQGNGPIVAQVVEPDGDRGHGNNREDGDKVDDLDNPGAAKKHPFGEDPNDGNSGWGRGGRPVSP